MASSAGWPRWTITSSRIARSPRWADRVTRLVAFRGISTRAALGLIAEIGGFRRFAHPRELASYLGITPNQFSCGASQHRGHVTKSGNRRPGTRRLLWAEMTDQPARAARNQEVLTTT